MIAQGETELTPAEATRHGWEEDEHRLAREHELALSRLRLDYQREVDQAELELRKLEARWSSWLSLPRYILKLPILAFFGIAYMIHAIRKTKPSQEFWDFVRR